MRERDYERVIAEARRLESIAEACEGEQRRDQLQSVLDDVVSRLDCRRADDLAAAAMLAVVEAWQRALEIEQLDADFADIMADDEDDAVHA